MKIRPVRQSACQLLSISVNDFELSVRSRNCLQKMGVETLGDLVRTSEQQLLASKNFGETSLVEIREMLASKGLSWGSSPIISASRIHRWILRV
jgi:DNA-directed RNA polymerase subunit alpha